MSDVRGELRNVTEVASLAGRISIGTSVQGECERFVVCENMKWATLKEMPEVFDGLVHRKQFPVEGTVASLGWGHLLGEECDGVPGVFDVLLENSTDGSVRGVGHETGGGVGLWVGQERGIG